ncbi:hypothetical protein BH09PSE4_BH09PSE4_08220 [soil metagenome]
MADNDIDTNLSTAPAATIEKSFFEKAQEVLTDAVEDTIEAVKENPLAAAGIAAGVGAAVAGAAFGVSKLLGDDAPTTTKKK